MKWLWRGSFGLAGGVMAGCSAMVLPVEECGSNSECQEAFGYGSQCADGLCEMVEMHPRCDASEPAELTFPLPKEENYMLASLFGRTTAHVARYRAAELAVRQVNESSALEGRVFNILHCSYEEDPSIDDLNSEEAVVEVSDWLANVVGVPVVVGPAASTLAEAVYTTTAEAYGMLTISPSATSEALINIDGLRSTDADPGLFWRTAPPDRGQGEAIVNDMRNYFDPRGLTIYRRAPTSALAILHETGAYGEGLATDVSTQMTAAGGTTTFYPYDNDGGLATAIAEIAADGSYDEVLVISANSSTYSDFLVAAVGNRWYYDRPIFMSDGGRTIDLLTDGVSASELFSHVRGSVPSLPAGVVFDTFDAAYRSAYQEPSDNHSYVAHTYDAAWIALYGHAWSVYQTQTGVTGQSIAQGLRKLSSGTPVNIQPNSWNNVVANFKVGSSVDIDGASGPLDYDRVEGEIGATIEIWTINSAGNNFDEQYVYQP